MKQGAATDFNFYALAGEASAPILFKLPLDREMQLGLTVHFESLRTLFTKDAELLKYDAGYRPEARTVASRAVDADQDRRTRHLETPSQKTRVTHAMTDMRNPPPHRWHE